MKAIDRSLSRNRPNKSVNSHNNKRDERIYDETYLVRLNAAPRQCCRKVRLRQRVLAQPVATVTTP